MGRTPLSINNHGLAHEDARNPPNCSSIALHQLRKRTCSLGKGETNAGTPWRCCSLRGVEGAGPHLEAGFLSSREWQRRGPSGPFLSCPNASGEA